MSRLRVGLALLAAVPAALGASGAGAHTTAAPRYGGTLVVGMVRSSEPDSLDPTVARSGSSMEIFKAICERLYAYDAKGRPVPQLAAALPVLSKDKLSYTVQLRKGVKFNDGTPFDSEALLASIERFRTHPLSVMKDEYATVDRVTATGPFTVVFRLNARDSVFLTNPYALSPTQLAKVGDEFGAKPVCVGPFTFDDRVVGDHVTVLKSQHYYGHKDVYLDKVIFRSIGSQASGVAALKAGDVDVLDSVPTTELASVRQSSSFRVLESPQFGWTSLFINVGNTNGAGNLPYGKVETDLASSSILRQAFEEAIDRNALNRVVFEGVYQPNCSLVATANTVWYEATKIPCTPYAPKHARQLVTQSGISNPTVHLLTSSGGTGPRVAQFIKEQAREVGIDVVIDTTDAATSLASAVAGRFDAYLFGLQASVADPHETIYRFLQSSGASNRSGYSNPRLDFILGNTVKATDFKARSTLYRAAQQIVAKDRPMIVLYNTTQFVGVNARVTGVRLAPNGNVLVTNARFR